MTKVSKDKAIVGNMENAKIIRKVADKMESGSISAYSFVILESTGDKIDVTTNSGVMEYDEEMYMVLLQAMERQWMDCIARKKQMLYPEPVPTAN